MTARALLSFEHPALEPDPAWRPEAGAPSTAAEAAQDQGARSQALERLALEHARCDDAAAACYYLCRSLGAARQLGPEEPGLELLFQLLGALSELPLASAAAAEPAQPAAGEADDPLGVIALCEQLQSARQQSQQAWRERSDENGPAQQLH